MISTIHTVQQYTIHQRRASELSIGANVKIFSMLIMELLVLATETTASQSEYLILRWKLHQHKMI